MESTMTQVNNGYLVYRPPVENSHLETGIGMQVPSVLHPFINTKLEKLLENQEKVDRASRQRFCSLEDCTSKTIHRVACYLNPDDKTQKVCRTCYQRIFRKKKALEFEAAGTTCAAADCRGGRIKALYPNPKNGNEKICQTCYHRIYHRIRRANLPKKRKVTTDKESRKEATWIARKQVKQVPTPPKQPEDKMLLPAFNAADLGELWNIILQPE